VPRPPTETLEFLRDEPDAVVERMAALADAHRGWVNLRPLVPGDDADDGAPVRAAGIFGVFGGTGPPVPLCTWTPEEVGIQHAAGPKVARRLVELRAPPVPDGWGVTQDHPKRGLVVRPSPDASVAEVLRWLVAVGEALCQRPVSGWWLAAVYR
jgi:hypothetical protein